VPRHVARIETAGLSAKMNLDVRIVMRIVLDAVGYVLGRCGRTVRDRSVMSLDAGCGLFLGLPCTLAPEEELQV
jgi:hypothetical protein